MPMPAEFELPRLREKPHDKRWDNLRPGLGRVRGVQNKICRDLKAGLLDAAIAHGADGEGTGGLHGYLFMLAAEHKKTFAGLLAKLLPLQVHSDTTSNAIINEVRVISVPAGHYMTPEALAAMQIKHTPAAEGMTFPASIDYRDEDPSPDPSPGQSGLEPEPAIATLPAAVVSEPPRPNFEVSRQRRSTGKWYRQTHPYDFD